MEETESSKFRVITETRLSALIVDANNLQLTPQNIIKIIIIPSTEEFALIYYK